MSVMALAVLGGFVSFLSTSMGAVGSFLSSRRKTSFRWNLSLDFALGLMVSASAFTLIGPAAVDASHQGSVQSVFLAACAGVVFVAVMKKAMDVLNKNSSSGQKTHLLLASVLMLHNFPEGLASGAALGGLEIQAALPILGGISLQNVPEGALMVFCLRALGWSQTKALLGGLGSGLVEMAGGVLAGFLLNSVDHVLPYILSAAGGAMIASVLFELAEGEGKMWQRLWSWQFAFGFLCLPFFQAIGL